MAPIYRLNYNLVRPPAFQPLRHSPHNRGLSLVEILVVVSVITVLALLLSPVLTKVRAAGNDARCTANLRQIITAYLTRINDDGGFFPPSRTGKEYDPATGGTRLPQGGFMHDMLREYIPSPTARLNRPGAKPSDAGVYWCPGRDPDKTSLTVPGEQGPFYSYAHNTELGGENSQPSQSWLGPNGGGTPNPGYNPGLARLAAVSRPSQIIAFAEQTHPGQISAGHLISSSWPFPANAGPTPPASGRQIDFSRHRGRANAAFLDGSVRALTFEDLRGSRTKFLIPEIE